MRRQRSPAVLPYAPDCRGVSGGYDWGRTCALAGAEFTGVAPRLPHGAAAEFLGESRLQRTLAAEARLTGVRAVERLLKAVQLTRV